MFGQQKQTKKPFQFDLEQDIAQDPSKGKQILEETHQKVANLKQLLREGVQNEDFDEYGVILHGYAALQRVLKRVLEKK